LSIKSLVFLVTSSIFTAGITPCPRSAGCALYCYPGVPEKSSYDMKILTLNIMPFLTYFSN
jgi:hypothetical protein